MSSSLSRVFAVALLVAVSAPSAQAQMQPYFGGGILSPSGEFADYAKAGWMVFGGVQRPLGQAAVIGLTASYGHAPHEGDFNTATNIPGITLDIGRAFGTGRFMPYVRGGVGFIQHRFDAGDTGGENDSETKFAFGAGGGVTTAVGSNTMFAGVHYTGAEDTNFLSIYVGFGLGGRPSAALRRW